MSTQPATQSTPPVGPRMDAQLTDWLAKLDLKVDQTLGEARFLGARRDFTNVLTLVFDVNGAAVEARLESSAAPEAFAKTKSFALSHNTIPDDLIDPTISMLRALVAHLETHDHGGVVIP